MHNSQSEKQKLSEITEIFKLLDKTFSQMKIFSQDHENVLSFAGQLYDKLKNFLDSYWKLEIEVEEFSFSFNGEPFFTQNQISKSLPFLMYKDGMKKLFFYKGVSREEFFDFLNILTRESNMPPEESDVVSAFWERDFTHIRYFAPDEYLESKIGAGMEIPDYSVDKNFLYSGTIELRPEDQEYLRKTASPESIPHPSLIKDADQISLKEEESSKLESVVHQERSSSQEKDFFSLLIEMLYFETGPEELEFSLNSLASYLQKHKESGDFALALNCLEEIQDFRSSLSPEDPRREAVDRIFSPDKIAVSLSLGKKLIDKNLIQDYRDFLQYLRLTGKSAIPILGYIYMKIHDIELKKQVADTLKQTGAAAPDELAKIASDEKPELTRVIIETLSSSPDTRSVNTFAQFVRFQNPEIRKSVIQALGKYQNETANKILSAFLTDDREDIRSLALDNINAGKGISIPQAVTDVMEEKNFHKKSTSEKKHFFRCLARMGSPETKKTIREFLSRTGRFSSSAKVDTGLACISALSQEPSPANLSILKEFSRRGNKKIKAAAERAYQQWEKNEQK